MSQTPISPTAFAAAMTRFDAGAPPFIAAAVSGGGDSLALALLLNDWTRERGGRMIALTVDHALRQGSADEAGRVQGIMAAHGIAHEILTWEGDKPATHIQERAREKRYELLTAACRRHGCNVLALAHNLEDRAETFWMRLAHGSGLDGLAGMNPSRPLPAQPGIDNDIKSLSMRGPVEDGEGEGSSRPASESPVSTLTPALSQHTLGEGAIVLIRPVLAFTRAELRATCMTRGTAWIEDPSNANDKFLRVRLRAFETLLGREGLTPARLARTMDKLGAAREALEFYAARALNECVTAEEGGATLDLAAFSQHPREIQSRVLAAALQAVIPQDYPPGSEPLENLRVALLSGAFAGRTLAGCVLSPRRGNICIRPEEAAGQTRTA